MLSPLVNFGATYHFPVNPESDFKADAQSNAETLTVQPLLTEVTDSILFNQEDEAASLDLSLEKEPSSKLSAFLNNKNLLVVKTPDSEEPDLAKEGALVRYLLEKVGLTPDRINSAVKEVINGNTISTPKIPPSDQEKANRETAFKKIEPTYVIPSDIERKKDSDLRRALEKHIKESDDEDDIVALLSNHPRIPEMSLENKFWVIDSASKKGFVKAVHKLRELKAPISHPNERHSNSIASTAARLGHTNIIKYLVEQGYSLEKSDLNGASLAVTATRENQLDTVKFLQKNGVDLNLTSDQGYNLMFYAAIGNHLEMVQYLAKQGLELTQVSQQDPATLMCIAAKVGNKAMMDFIKDRTGVELLSDDKNKKSTVHYAAEAGKIDIILNVLNPHGLNNLGKLIDKDARNPFHFAAMNAQLEIFKRLTRFFPYNIEARDYTNKTPAHYLAQLANKNDSRYTDALKCLKYLYSKDVNFDIKDVDGNTVWDMMTNATFKKRTLKKAMNSVTIA